VVADISSLCGLSMVQVSGDANQYEAISSERKGRQNVSGEGDGGVATISLLDVDSLAGVSSGCSGTNEVGLDGG
jgi:hypothetical protein